jgi:hypothetical protein
MMRQFPIVCHSPVVFSHTELRINGAFTDHGLFVHIRETYPALLSDYQYYTVNLLGVI